MQLLHWINDNAINEQLFIEVRKEWAIERCKDSEYSILLDQKWNEYQPKLYDKNILINDSIKNKKEHRLLHFMRYAAIFILIIGFSSTLYFLMDLKTLDYQQYALDSMELSGTNNNLLVLSDGRRVEIESKESQVNYNKDGTEIRLDTDTLLTEKSIVQNLMTEKRKNNLMIVPNGHQANLTLCDGTKVWLNAGSKLIFPSVFASDTREVYIEGEAFFDVTKNAKKPFIVITKGMNIKVFGTTFNVMAYPNDNFIETVLVTGKVQLENNNSTWFNREKTILYPGQYAGFQKDNMHLKVEDVDVESFISWKEGWYKLEKLLLSDVVTRLERYYALKIIIKDDNLKIMKITGKLDLNNNITQVMENIAQATKLDYKIKNDTISIFRKSILE